MVFDLFELKPQLRPGVQISWNVAPIQHSRLLCAQQSAGVDASNVSPTGADPTLASWSMVLIRPSRSVSSQESVLFQGSRET